MIIFFTFLIALIGLLIGSFLGAFITRFARSESVVKGRSHCDSCNHMLSWYENIPILSWSIQRGRCRHCHKQLSVFYPAIELATAVSFVSVFFLLLHPTIQQFNNLNCRMKKEEKYEVSRLLRR